MVSYPNNHHFWIQDAISRSSESNKSFDNSRLSEASNLNGLGPKERDRKESQTSKTGDKDKKSRKAWYNVLNPTYKSRSEELKRTFKELPNDERLIVGKKKILVVIIQHFSY